MEPCWRLSLVLGCTSVDLGDFTYLCGVFTEEWKQRWLFLLWTFTLAGSFCFAPFCISGVW